MSLQLSQTLSYLLRHGIIENNLTIDSEGFVNLDQILKFEILKNNKLIEIQKLISKDKKTRFTLKQIEDKWFIRANQGHSQNIGITLNDNKIHTEITKVINPCFHGTYKRFIESIQEEGLKIMSRTHVHMTNDIKAKSGIRHDCEALVFINMEKAMNDGIKFYESSNGVILSSGINGIINPKYIEKIEYIEII